MTAALALSLALAIASAIALNWGYFMQHTQAVMLPPLSAWRPLRSLRLLFSSRRWLGGFAIGLFGWALYAAALAFGPLSLVQAASAGGIGVLALLVARVAGVRLSVREWAGVWASVGGLALLGISLFGRATQHWGHASHVTATSAWIAASALLAALFAGPLSCALAPGAGLGVGAGLLYAAGDVATKAAFAGSALAFVPVLLAAHGLAFILLQTGFQRGSALATAGVATLLTNAAPIAAGMTLFGEPMPTGALAAVRIAAFATLVVGAVLLSRIDAATPPARRSARATAAFRRPTPDPPTGVARRARLRAGDRGASVPAGHDPRSHQR